MTIIPVVRIFPYYWQTNIATTWIKTGAILRMVKKTKTFYRSYILVCFGFHTISILTIPNLHRNIGPTSGEPAFSQLVPTLSNIAFRHAASLLDLLLPSIVLLLWLPLHGPPQPQSGPLTETANNKRRGPDDARTVSEKRGRWRLGEPVEVREDTGTGEEALWSRLIPLFIGPAAEGSLRYTQAECHHMGRGKLCTQQTGTVNEKYYKAGSAATAPL